MPDRLTNPSFPAPVEALAPSELVAAWGAVELGAFLHLVRCAWSRSPACSLPDDDSALAMMARVRPEEWTATKARLTPALRFADGLVHFDHARRTFDQLAAVLDRRRSASRQANDARWGAKDGSPSRPPDPGKPSDSHPNRIRFGSDSHPIRTLCASESGSARASSAPSKHRDESERLRGASEGRSEARAGLDGAGEARALTPAEFLDARRREYCASRLTKVRWLWAPAGKQWVPAAVVRALAGHPNATPMRVDYALQVVQDRHAAGETVRSPIGLVIAVLGAQRDEPGQPWEVPLLFAAAWTKKHEHLERLLAKQAEIDAQQAERLRIGARDRGARETAS